MNKYYGIKEKHNYPAHLKFMNFLCTPVSATLKTFTKVTVPTIYISGLNYTIGVE